MKIQLAAMIVLAAACSHNPLDPGAGNASGTGTNTLLVDGTALAEPSTPNASLDTSFTTHFDIAVTLNNVPVTTGTVTLTSHTGTATLTFQGNGNHWSGSIANYDEVYQLDVTSGPDKVSGVRVDGPDIHTFSAPAAGAALDVTMTNIVTWVRGAAAQEARFSADSGDLVVADTGTYSVPPLTLKFEKDVARPNTLRLTRTNSEVPAGAVAGSTFTVGVAQELDVVALACPTCP